VIDESSRDRPGGRTLVVTLQLRSGALDRLIGLVRRQGCTIAAMTVVPSDSAGLGVATLALEGGNPNRVAQQALRLVDVVRVASPTDGD
jgi:acetolactate synthase small subunit